MGIELDHLFVCCEVGGESAAPLTALGLNEGPPAVHEGQGTANRRFFFRNSYIELLWVYDEEAARRRDVRRTRLWQRWTERDRGACPFGIAFRPTIDDPGAPAPFAAWSYYPPYLQPGQSIEFARGTTLDEPELFFLGFARPRAGGQAEGLNARQVTSISIGVPTTVRLSETWRALEGWSGVAFERTEDYGVRVTLDGGQVGERCDLRPGLPLVIEW